MRNFRVYIRQHEVHPWCYNNTYPTASVAWAAMMIARTHGFQTKVESTPHVDVSVVDLSMVVFP